MRILNKIKWIFILLSIVVGQELVIKTQHISQSRGYMTGDSLKLVGSIGASLTHNGSGDSLSLVGGFLSAVNGIYKTPPTLTTEVSDTIPAGVDSVMVQAIANDINGIISAKLYVQIGGSSEIIEIPMYSLDDSTYQASIPDSLLSVRNFRSWVVTVDGMYYEATSNYSTPVLEFGENELKMDDTLTTTRFPDGVISNRWRMVSWPAELLNGDLKNSNLENGYVFYDWDLKTGKWTKPDSIITGKAYWFKHNYKDNVVFTNNNSGGRALPLVDYELTLKDSGWNIIGSPFSFPVKVQSDSTPVSLYTFGYNDSTETDGWTEPTETLIPWSGYAVHAKQKGQILTLKTSTDGEDNRVVNRYESEEWILNLKLRSETYLDYSAVIGRNILGKENRDNLDIFALPTLESYVAVRTDINGSGKFKYGADIRSIDTFNGVWKIKLISDGIDGPYTFSIGTKNDFPSGLDFALLDIPNKNVITNIFEENLVIHENLDNGYDLVIIAGDEQYVYNITNEILRNIPDVYSLGQNYPNPFNPTTKIDISLPRSGDVYLTIYNLIGQQVNVLLNSNLEYGYHSVIWNGLDQLGKPVASGVYFSELRTRNFRQTKKMLLLK